MTTYANVGSDGVIVIEPSADHALRRLPIGSADKRNSKDFVRVVRQLAKLGEDGVTISVPNWPHDSNNIAKVDALNQFRELLTVALKRNNINPWTQDRGYGR